MAANGSDLAIVSPTLINWKSIFIEQFGLGIGDEWLLRMCGCR